jgi:hypothetical protein
MFLRGTRHVVERMRFGGAVAALKEAEIPSKGTTTSTCK